MLTGACGSCHETMSFEDHQAGATVPCQRCCQGWVRVPAAGVTASVPSFAQKGETTSPDTAVTDQRPATRRAPLPDHPPAAAACPRCGSAAFKRPKAKPGATLTFDRECKECGAPYMTVSAPMTGTVRAAMYVSDVVLILGGVLGLLFALAAMQEGSPTQFPVTPLYAVFFSMMAGFGLLSMPSRTQDQREKRLKEYQASAPPGAPPPVEISAPPDMVSLSLLFGILSVAAPLVSSLLVVVVFGPAAVACGLAAVAQGHLKGLIGLALGVVSLTVCGLIFFFLLQG